MLRLLRCKMWKNQHIEHLIACIYHLYLYIMFLWFHMVSPCLFDSARKIIMNSCLKYTLRFLYLLISDFHMVFSFFPPGFPWQTHPSSTLPAAPCRRSALPQRDPSWRFTQQLNFRRSFHGFSFGEVFSSTGSPTGVVLICVGWWLGPGAYV